MASSTVEDYIKHIYLVSEKSGKDQVSMGSVAEALGVVPGTATTMVKALADAGLVDYAPRVGVHLTVHGRKLALHVLRRHRLIEQFLVEVLVSIGRKYMKRPSVWSMWFRIYYLNGSINTWAIPQRTRMETRSLRQQVSYCPAAQRAWWRAAWIHRFRWRVLPTKILTFCNTSPERVSRSAFRYVSWRAV